MTVHSPIYLTMMPPRDDTDNDENDGSDSGRDDSNVSDVDSESCSNSDHSSERSSSSADDDASSVGSDNSNSPSVDEYSQHNEAGDDDEVIMICGIANHDNSNSNMMLCNNEMEEEMQQIMHKRSTRKRRIIILVLSTLLTLLLINFGYQLYRLSQMQMNNNNPSSSIVVVDEEHSIELERSHHHHQDHEHAKKLSDTNDNNNNQQSTTSPTTNNKEQTTTKKEAAAKENNNKPIKQRQTLQDHAEYKLPRYPTRIYTHASLSSRNYRAGGVLSDEMLTRFEEDGVIVIRNLVSPKLLDRLGDASQMLIDEQQDHDEGTASSSSKKKKRGKQFHMVKNGAIFLGVPSSSKRENGSMDCIDNAEEGGGVCQEKLDTTLSKEEPGDSNVETNNDEDDDNVILSSFRDLAMYSKIPRVAASLLRLDELRVGGEEHLKPDSKRRRRRRRKQTKGGEEDEDDVEDYIDDSINLRICRDIFLTKDDDNYACGWHVDDTGFWPSIASDPGVNAWVALDDFPAPPKPGKTKQPNVNVDATVDDEGSDESSYSKSITPVATFALSLGSHRSSWRHEAYEVTGSTHTIPPEGFQSAMDLIQRRKGSGTCNIQTSAPHLYENLEKNKVIYDLKKGDVIFHDRWVFHRTVTVDEYDSMANNGNPNYDVDRKQQPAVDESKIFRRYSIRYSPGSATVPPGYGVEPSVLHDSNNANSTLDEIVERSGMPWYPKVWPHVLKRKPIIQSSSSAPASDFDEEEIDGITELVHDKMPQAQELQKKRKKEIQRLLNMRGGL